MSRQLRLLTILLLSINLFAEQYTDISAELQSLLDGTDAPSIAAAVIKDGELKFAGAYGLRRAGSQEEVTLQDKYHIGSITKSLTATLAAILVKDGTISWDTTVGDIFTEIEIHSGYKDVTLKQLLNNTGGVSGKVNDDLWNALWRLPGTNTEQRLYMVESVLRFAPAYTPGTKYEYSNLGYAIAGTMLEVATELRFEQLLSERLFASLELETAGYRAPATGGIVNEPYGHRSRWGRPIPVEPEPAGDNPRATAPAGAVHMSILDLADYAQFHLGNTHQDLLTAEERAILYEPSEHKSYGMGWIPVRRNWAEGTALTHSGSNTSFYATIWLAPEKNSAAMVAINYGGKGAFDICDKAVKFLVDNYILK